jgi:hypothetical protein
MTTVSRYSDITFLGLRPKRPVENYTKETTMVKTLITDDFVPGPAETVEENYNPHNILYGSQGWTDDVDDATVESLVQAGIVSLDRIINGVGFETRIYISREGNGPR